MVFSASPPPSPSFNEVATTGDGKDITRELTGKLLEPQDKVLKSKGGKYEIYEDILRDDQVQSCFQQRRLAVVCREWQVIPGDETPQAAAAAEWMRGTLERIHWDSVTDKMLYGVFYGYAVAECIYGPGEQAVELLDIKVRKQRRFKFGVDGLLKLITKDNANGEDLPPAKFWSFAVGADNDDEPYGLGLAHYLYWPVFFKRNGLKSWLKFLEQWAGPTKKGTYQPGATEEEKKRLLQALAAIGEDSGVILPEGMEIELIEAARSGTADYATLQERMNAAIAKVILSQTMTTDNGSSLAQAQVHQEVKLEVVKADADLVCASFNETVVKWLIDWNFPGVAYPRVWRRVKDEPDLMVQAQRDEILTRIGFTPNQDYVQATYGEGFGVPEEVEQPRISPAQTDSLLKILDQTQGYTPEKRSAILRLAFPTLPEDQIAILVAEDVGFDSAHQAKAQDLTGGVSGVETQPATINLSEGLPQAPDTVTQFVVRLRERAQPEFERMTLRLRSALEESADLLEFRERLDDLYPEMDGEMLTQVMAEAMFASKLAGLFEAQEEAQEG